MADHQEETDKTGLTPSGVGCLDEGTLAGEVTSLKLGQHVATNANGA